MANAATTLRSLTFPIYFPAFLTQAANGMLLPLLPLYMKDIGHSESIIGVVLAAAGVGGVLAQAPFGTLIAKRTARLVILISVALMALTLVALRVSGNEIWLGTSRLVWGAGSTGWLIGLQTRMTRATTSAVRGRAMSTWGGTMRFSLFVGPFFGGVAADHYGFGTTFTLASGLMALSMIPTAIAKPLPPPAVSIANVGLPTWQAVRPYLDLVLKAGSAHMCLIAARSGRFVVLPLVGKANGMSTTEIGTLIAIGSFADLVLFPVAGYLMDSKGRLYAMVPAFLGFMVGMIMLGLADSRLDITIAAVVIGIFNGIGSGTMLTMSSDLAPAEATSQFLASVGTLRDVGKIMGPLLVGVLADAVGLGASAISLAVLASVGLAIIVFGIGETRDRQATSAAA